jgi:hypothetical protein
MKKLITIAALLVFALSFTLTTQAQITKTRTLNSTQYYLGDDTDYSLTTVEDDSVLTYTVLLNKAGAVYYDVQIALDSVSGTPDYDIDLKSKVFIDDVWTDQETDVTWDGTSTDTTVLFQEHSTAIFARYLQLQINGQAGTGAATLDKIEIEIWP